LTQVFNGNQAIIRVFDWLSSISGSKVMFLAYFYQNFSFVAITFEPETLESHSKAQTIWIIA